MGSSPNLELPTWWKSRHVAQYFLTPKLLPVWPPILRSRDSRKSSLRCVKHGRCPTTKTKPENTTTLWLLIHSRASIYDIFTHIWPIFMVNVGRYTMIYTWILWIHVNCDLYHITKCMFGVTLEDFCLHRWCGPWTHFRHVGRACGYIGVRWLSHQNHANKYRFGLLESSRNVEVRQTNKQTLWTHHFRHLEMVNVQNKITWISSIFRWTLNEITLNRWDRSIA